MDDYDLATASQIASSSDVCLVFVNANSGEDVATVEGNKGDRNNLVSVPVYRSFLSAFIDNRDEKAPLIDIAILQNLWHNGEALIATVANACSQTIVIAHTVGPVIMESFVHHPSVKGILFAHLPGQETGNSLVDTLFGVVPPSGRLPYTIGKSITDYAAQVVYTAPAEDSQQIDTVQIDYTEGLLIDYRWFDQMNIEPT